MAMTHSRIVVGLLLLPLLLVGSARASHVDDWNSDGVIVIGCLGDSNTTALSTYNWCGKLATLVSGFGWQVQNYGVPGATVLDPNPLSPNFTSTAAQQYQQSLADAHPPDVFVLAFGTNDVRGAGSVPNIVAAYSTMKQTIEAGGRRAVIALTPHVCDTDLVNGTPTNTIIDSLNASIQSTFTGADDLVDFYSILDPATDYSDCLHMNEAGQTKRANTAFDQLTPQLFVQDIREVVQFPRPTNNGKVLGHDNGASVLFGGKSYWFFADTLIDTNNTGVYDSGDGFIGTGTVATTTDLDASNGMDMTYRASGGTAQGLFSVANMKSDECLLWPGGAVVGNGKIYLYTTGVKKDGGGNCTLGNQTEVFLATVDATTLVPTRLATLYGTTDNKFDRPFNVSEPDGCGGQIKWIYVAGTKPLDPPGTPYARTGYLLSRVSEAQVEDPTKYQYWDGSDWVVGDPSAAQPMFEEVWGGNTASIAYNASLGRYLVVYTCGLTGSVCGRTADDIGSLPEAPTGGWSPPVTLYRCPGGFFSCYAGAQHPEYASSSKIYVTTARNTPFPPVSCQTDSDCFCPSDPNPVNQCVIGGSGSGTCTTPQLRQRYEIRLREVTVGPTRPPDGRIFADAGRDYSPAQRCDTPVQGLNGWSYKRLSGSTLTDLTYDWLWNWKGPDLVSGFPAPDLDEDTGFPGQSTDAVRVWQAPGAGTVRISGEARKRQTCGDAVIAQAIRIHGGAPVGSALWAATLNPTTRSAVYNFTTTVAAGDSIGFKVKRGGTSAACDEVFLAPTITYTP